MGRSDQSWVELLRWALPQLGLRWGGFRRPRRQVCRRIRRRYQSLGLEDVSSYRAFLETHPEEWPELDRCCRVTISRFYRDRSLFDRLGTVGWEHLVRLAGSTPDRCLRVWSTGCASGEEPYSVALSWHFLGRRREPGLDLRLVASDLDLHLLARARRGRYRRDSLRELPADWIAEAFTAMGDELELQATFRSRVRFLAADLRHPPVGGPFHLILCRNLAFTYYSRELQERVGAALAAHLATGGLLAVGAHEAVPDPGPELRPVPWSRLVYVRR